MEYVQSGTTALQDAKTLQKKTRKWMCCAIILLLVTAAVIVIVVSMPVFCMSPHGAACQQQDRSGARHVTSVQHVSACSALAYTMLILQACTHRHRMATLYSLGTRLAFQTPKLHAVMYALPRLGAWNAGLSQLPLITASVLLKRDVISSAVTACGTEAQCQCRLCWHAK